MDERPVRCWVHPKLKLELEQWHKKLNIIAVEKTNYPIQRLENIPLASNLCSLILTKIRLGLKDKDFKITKGTGKNNRHLKIEIILADKEGDNNNLNIELQKIGGTKKNEIKFW